MKRHIETQTRIIEEEKNKDKHIWITKNVSFFYNNSSRITTSIVKKNLHGKTDIDICNKSKVFTAKQKV